MSENSKHSHPIAGDAPSEPKVEATKVSEELRNPKENWAKPSAGTRSNSKNPEKEYIPIHGGSSETLGHTYPEMPLHDAVEDKGAHRRAVTPQIAQHPVHVPPSQRNKSGN